MRPETKPSRCFPHTHKTMLAAICIASALARRSAPERPSWSLRDDLPAPFLILPGPPARSKGLVYGFWTTSHICSTIQKSVRTMCLSCRLGRGSQPMFIRRSRTVQQSFTCRPHCGTSSPWGRRPVCHRVHLPGIERSNRHSGDFRTRDVRICRYGLAGPVGAGVMDFHTAQTKEFTMTGTQGSPLSENHGQMLRLFLALEEAKDTIRQFEAGEITIHEALRRLALVASVDNAGA